MPSWLLLLVVLTAQVNPSLPAVYSNYATLATDLFANYKKEIRPLVDTNTPVQVYVAMWLSSIQELDEINQQLTFSALVLLEWDDANLAWDTASYNNTVYMSYPQKDVWIPDITIMNSMESMKELGFDRNYLYLTYVGRIQWIVGGVFKTSCDIDVTYYPFDTQVCVIILTTLTSTINEVDLDFSRTDSVSLEWYSKSGSWKLVSFQVDFVPDTAERSRVAFSITMKRLRLYYVVTIIIPVLFLALTATLVFALPADSGEKMGTSITVLLAFAVYLTIVAEQMPKTSTQVSVMAVYLTLLLGVTAMGVILTVWILNLTFRDDEQPPGKHMQRIALFLQKVMCKQPKTGKVAPREGNSTDVALEAKSTHASRDKRPTSASSVDKPDMTWRTVAFIFDRWLFYSFSVFLCLVTVIFMSLLAIGGN